MPPNPDELSYFSDLYDALKGKKGMAEDIAEMSMEETEQRTKLQEDPRSIDDPGDDKNSATVNGSDSIEKGNAIQLKENDGNTNILLKDNDVPENVNSRDEDNSSEADKINDYIKEDTSFYHQKKEISADCAVEDVNVDPKNSLSVGSYSHEKQKENSCEDDLNTLVENKSQAFNQPAISIEVQSATVDDVDQVDASDCVMSLDNIQSEVMLAINSSTGFLDSDPPSISSDPPSTADLDSSPYKSSLGIDSANCTENLSKGNSTSSSITDLRPDESLEVKPDNMQTSDTLSQDDELLTELSHALQTDVPHRTDSSDTSNDAPNGLKVSHEETLQYQKIRTQLGDLKKLSLDQQEEINR